MRAGRRAGLSNATRARRTPPKAGAPKSNQTRNRCGTVFGEIDRGGDSRDESPEPFP